MPSGHALQYFHYAKYQAKRRGLSFSLNPQEFVNLVQMPCFFCAIEPVQLASKRTCAKRATGDIKCHSLDRLDNAKGYVRGNVVPCCWDCNKIKNVMPIGGLLCHLPRMLMGLTNYLSHSQNLKKQKHSISASDVLLLSTERHMNWWSVPHSSLVGKTARERASRRSGASTSTSRRQGRSKRR